MDLPRSRALIQLDGPRHIMPLEPVTPPDSAAWRVIHRPVTLTVIAVGLLVVAALALNLLGVGFQLVARAPGLRYVAPPIGAMAIVGLYCLFVSVVERRRSIEEFGRSGALAEFALGCAVGLTLSFSTFAILVLLGALHVVGFNPPHNMFLPLVSQFCTAVILEIILCGLAFRMVERWLGSWLALALMMATSGAVRFFGSGDTALALPATFAVMIETVLLFAIPYMMTRRLWAAIGLTAAWKIAQFALYVTATAIGLQGLVLSFMTGPDWLTGGRAGADASTPALCMSAILATALLIVAVRRGRIVRPAWQRGRPA